MVKSTEEILTSLRTLFPDEIRDEYIELLEDISDSVKASTDNVDVQKQIDEVEKKWKEKYIKRFYDTTNETKDTDEFNENKEEEETKEYKYENLFEEKEG